MKIAVCDDDKLLTGEIDRQLQGLRQRMGISFETEIFFDGTTLWDSIERNGSYDIIYLDIEMKNMDGITVAKKIREQDPYTILLFVSSYDSYYEQLFEVEPLRLLRKPIDPGKFEEYFRIAYGKLMNLDERLHFEFNKRLYQIPYREIIYMESQRRVIRLVAGLSLLHEDERSDAGNQQSRKHVYTDTLFICCELLLYQIVQCHRSGSSQWRNAAGQYRI